jgi:hypothetical protein
MTVACVTLLPEVGGRSARCLPHVDRRPDALGGHGHVMADVVIRHSGGMQASPTCRKSMQEEHAARVFAQPGEPSCARPCSHLVSSACCHCLRWHNRMPALIARLAINPSPGSAKTARAVTLCCRTEDPSASGSCANPHSVRPASSAVSNLPLVGVGNRRLSDTNSSYSTISK